MGKITYDNKIQLNENANIPNNQKCRAVDMNEIKNIVNGNDDIVGALSDLSTSNKTSVINAINEVNSKHITYLNNTQLSNGFTPTEDCYIELYGASSGWGYAGAKTELVITNTVGNAEQIVKTQAGTQGHDTIPDSMFTTSVYKLTANVLYKFTLGGVSGGNIYSGLYGKLIPFI